MIRVLIFLLFTYSSFANIGNIMAFKGTAEVHRLDTATSHMSSDSNESNTSSIIAVSSGMEILEGDEIVTHKKTKIQVVLKDDTIITIGANTSLKFDKYLFDNTKNSTLTMSSDRGFFRSVTGKIGKVAPERFTVKTSSATIGIRGTDFSVRIGRAIERFKCYSGTIRIFIGNKFKDLSANEEYELKTNKLFGWSKNLGKNTHDKFTPNSSDIADITQFERRGFVTEHYRPKPIIPDGVPCTN